MTSESAFADHLAFHHDSVEIKQFLVSNAAKFKILHLNINSIFFKFHEVNGILNKNSFDLVFIQETKLPTNTPDAFISNNNYNLIRRDRVASGGGLAIYCKKVYTITNTLIDPLYETISFTVVLKAKRSTKYTFISSYNPHFSYAADYLKHLGKVIKLLRFKSKSPCILIGDLNQDLLSVNGDNLKSLLANSNFHSYLDKPTHIAKTKSSAKTSATL